MGSFEAFYARWFADVVAVGRRYTSSTTEAEDIAQDAFARAYDRWTQLQGHPEPQAWVKLVAANCGRSQLRRNRLKHPAAWTEPPTRDDADLILLRADLIAALARVPIGQRSVLVLHYLNDLPVREIASALGASEPSVKTALHRGRLRLAIIMRGSRT